MSHKTQGFTVLNLKHRSDRNTCHQLFVKEYSSRKVHTKLPEQRTLLILNVPPYVHEQELKFAFERIGEVENVYLGTDANDLPPMDDETSDKYVGKYFNTKKSLEIFKCAWLVFKASRSLRAALKEEEVVLHQNERTILVTGMDKWMSEYTAQLTNEKELEVEVNKFMNVFEVDEMKEKEQEKRMETDEDGWTVVKKSGRNAGFQQKETVITKIEDKIAARKSKKELANFYTFQIRESKQRHIISMRKKFEADKRKVEQMKKERKFKPLGSLKH
ncbi:Ribosomal RNA-processing protein 7 like A [Pseudolycoriella hygida]|uniref:Ribosomal RNA-processing protein 7 like A n=1 Tax=Pseudolycoriella hygida TaxID=35572 RepID=A0A9Q0S0K8_9DIPT|nr:Ribosomal RNA-processing protein 7 like A [Pseudolycoriella hygida]